MNEKGFVLVAALVMLLALTVMGVMMVNTSVLETKLSGTGKEDTQALFLAEAGISQVGAWFQNPDTFTPVANGFTSGISIGGGNFIDCSSLDPSTISNMSTQCTSYSSLTSSNERSFFKRRFAVSGLREYISGDWSQLVDVNGDGIADTNNSTDSGSDTAALSITNSNYLNSIFSDFSGIGTITSIKIFPPMLDKKSGTTKPRTICTVRVAAKTASGYIRTIEQEIKESIFLPINAGAEAGGALSAWNGNGTIRWGDVWAKGNVQFQMSNTPYKCGDTTKPDYDKWFSAKIEGAVTASGRTTANGCPGTPDCIGCTGQDGDATKRPWQNYAIYQNQTVTLDKWDKSLVKSYSQDYGYYYKSVDGSNVYLSNKNGELLGSPISLQALLTDPNRPALLYVDASTVSDQTMNLNVSGRFFSNGDIYIDGSLGFSGGGSGSTISVKDPDGNTQTLSDINFQGVLYITKDLKGTGSPKVFGGILAENGGILSSGSPTIWYDVELKDGRRNLPKTGRGRWREIM